jgi:hypothetical protein
MKKVLSLTILCFCIKIIQAQTFDYNDLEKGYVEWENINSFCFDIENESQTFPLAHTHWLPNGKALWAAGSYTPWPMELSCPGYSGGAMMATYNISSVSSQRFKPVTAWIGLDMLRANCEDYLTTTAMMPVYGGWIPQTNASIYINKSILKKVYYGNEGGGIIYLRELSNSSQSDDYFNGSLLCFAPYTSTRSTNFRYNTGFHFSQPIKSGGWYKPTTAISANKTIATRAYSIKQGSSNTVFNVNDWAGATWSKDVESYQDATGRVRNLNGGVEVYVVFAHQERMPGSAGDANSNGHQDGILDGVRYQFDQGGNPDRGGFFGLLGTYLSWYRYANLARVHVYPARPKWKESSVKASYCSSETIDLTSLLDLGNGKFTGKFVIEKGSSDILVNGTTLDFSILGDITTDTNIGVRCYPYYTEDNDANISMYMEITVAASEPLTDNGEQFVCSSSEKLILDRYSPWGGTYSGSHIKNNELDVAAAVKANLFAISVTYKYLTGNGCTMSKSYTQAITPSADVTFEDVGVICDDVDIDLEKYVTPSGGTFSGHGIVGNIFSPVAAGVGYHPITYSYINEAYGCETIITQEIQVRGVNPTVTFKMIPALCQNEDFIDLNDYIEGFDSNPGGTFAGTGVQNGHYFYPEKAKEGFNKVTYSYGSPSTCKKTIETEIRIKGVETLSFAYLKSVCDVSAIDLSNLPNIKGGTFTGPGVANNVFIPEQAGLGTVGLVYTAVIDNSCTVSGTLSVLVSDLLPPASDVKFDDIPQFCATDANYYDLTLYVRGHSGGSYSGRGVENYRFYPSRAVPGFNTITYAYGSGTCRSNIQTEAYVNALPTVQFTGLGNVCDNGAIDLNKHISPAGGTFTGPGISGAYFYPAVAGLGQHVITYDAFVGDCPVHGEKTMNVVGLVDNDASILPIDDVCITDENYIDLRAYLINATDNGVFSGPGVDGVRLYPARAKEGFNTIRYSFSVGTCNKTITQEVFVKSVQTVTIRSIPAICEKRSVDLSSYTDIKGGVFSGPGVSGNTFLSEAAGIGQHSIKYTVNFGQCTNSAVTAVNVSGLREADISFREFPTLCKSDSGYIDLRPYVRNHEGGNFAGTGVENYRFYPSRARDGFNTVTYTFDEGSCKKSINAEILINPTPVITARAVPKVCQNNAMLELDKYVTPTGGYFTGFNINSQGLMSVSSLDIGKYDILYIYSDINSCVAKTALQIDVADLCPPTVTWKSDLPQFCNTDDDYVELQDYINNYVEAGTFTGTGVENGRFYPGRAREGFNTISYAYGNGVCKKTIKAELYVYAAQSILLNNIPRVCTKAVIDLFPLVNIKGGTFSYAGMTISNTFYPENYGIGKHELDYKVRYANCVSRTKLTIEVADLMEADIAFDSIPEFCANDEQYYELSSYIHGHTGGTFAGTGVENGRFYPSKAKQGFNTITYTYGESACRKTITGEIFIRIPETIKLNNIPRICTKDHVDLEGLVNIKGGNFSYMGTTIFNVMRPDDFGIGKHDIEYTVTEYGGYDGCTSKTKFTIEIADLMEANIAFDSLPVMCLQDLGHIDLRAYVRNHEAGTFTGTGVETGRFYPSRAKEGFNTISYTFGEGTCKKIIKSEIEIVNYKGVSVSFVPIPSRCDTTSVNLLDYVNIKTGVFSGTGVSGNTFYPDAAGIGKHEIAYVVRDSIFSVYANTVVEVVSLLSSNVHFKTLPAFCRSQQEAIDLMEYIENSESGTFTGKGVQNSRYFYPSDITTEDNTITYTYGTGTCKRSISVTVKVYTAPNNGRIEIDDVVVCCGSQIDIGKMVVPAGGTFTGEYITPQGVYSGNLATTGDILVIYTIANKGCIVSKEITIRNENTESFNFNVDVEVVGDGGKVHFVPQSMEEDNYHWNFGDGAYSFEVSPWHYYYHPGTHTITLEVKDRKGCIHSVIRDGFISVAKSAMMKMMTVGDVTYILSEEKDDTRENQEEGIKIYPNPTTGYCYVDRAELLERIVIYNVIGNVVYDNIATGQIKVPGPQGIYFIKCLFKDKKRTPQVIKIIKQ